MSYTIFTLGPLDGNDRVHTFLEASDLGVPNVEWQAADGIQYDVNDDALVDAYFRIRIHGDDAEDLDARIAAWRAQVPHPLNGVSENTFTYGLPGRTSVVTGTVLYSKVAVPSITHLYVAGDQAVLELHLTRRPHLTTPAQLIHDATGLDSPALASLAAMTTEYETPLALGLTAPGADLQRLYAAIVPSGLTIADLVLHAVTDLTWSAGAAAAEVAGYPDGVGNTCWRTNALAGAYTDIADTDFAPGEYIVLLNAKGTTANTAYAKVGSLPYVAIPTTALALLVLGTVTLPYQTVRGSGTSALRVTIKGDDGANYAWVNYVALLPAPVLGWAATSAAASLYADDGAFYADDIADRSHVVSPSKLRAAGGSVAVLSQGSTAAPTLHTHLTASATPRHAQFPG
jgi:hypothetical protein